MFRKLLVCVDGSASSLKAVHAAMEIARKFDSKIILLNVFDPSVVHAAATPLPDAPLATATNDGCYAREMEKRSLQEARAAFDGSGLAYCAFTEIGHPVDRILAAAHDMEADLIIMGKRGNGGFDKLLLGSVSDGVLSHAHCTAMIVQ